MDESIAMRPDDMEMLNLIASFQHDSRHKTAALPDLSTPDDDPTGQEQQSQDVR